MRIVLLCHAATAATRAARFPAPDEPLDAASLDRLVRRPVGPPRHAACFASPAPSVAMTAAALRLAPTLDDDLRDLDHGAWAGASLDAVLATDPAGMAAWRADPAAAPHGGETLSGLMRRVGRWLDAREGAAGTILAVTHAAVIRAAVVHALGAAPSCFWHIDVAPLARAALSGGAGRWSLAGLTAPGRSWSR